MAKIAQCETGLREKTNKWAGNMLIFHVDINMKRLGICFKNDLFQLFRVDSFFWETVTSQDVITFYFVIFVQNLILLLIQFAFLAVFWCFVFALSLSLLPLLHAKLNEDQLVLIVINYWLALIGCWWESLWIKLETPGEDAPSLLSLPPETVFSCPRHYHMC